jgi:hypothetical protein
VLVGSFLAQLAVGCALFRADEQRRLSFRNRIDADVAGLADCFAVLPSILVPVSCAFYALVVFDMMARDGGDMQSAAGAALVLLVLPLLLLLLAKAKALLLPNYAKLYVEEQAKLLAVQTSYQRDAHKQFSPLGARPSPEQRKVAETVNYNFRVGDSARSLSPLGISSHSSIGSASKGRRNIQIIDLEHYVN